MRIEAATSADLPAIAALAHVIWREFYTPIIGAAQVEWMLSQRYAPGRFEAFVAGGVTVEVLRDGPAVRGWSAHGPGDGPLARPGDWKLHQLYLHAPLRRQGWGSRLLANAIAAARAAGAPHLILCVNRANHAAIAAYRARGFRVRGDHVLDIGGGYVMDDHVMELAIPVKATRDDDARDAAES